MDLIEVTKCDICNNPYIPPGIDLGPMPLPDKLIPFGSDETCDKYPTEVLHCDTCQTSQQHWVVPQKTLFPPEYHYRGVNTKDVLSGMEGLVKVIDNHRDVNGLKVLDVGCNDGSLLNAFYRRGALTYGIEPTDAAIEARRMGHRVRQVYLNINTAIDFVKEEGHPDVITFVNVFAHIEDFSELVTALKILCGPTTEITIENHYLGSVLERNQFDTFYHEHIRTYSFTSFEYIAGRLGMKIGNVEFPSRYGGNIRVTIVPGSANHRWDLQLSAHESNFGWQLSHLNNKVAAWKEKKRNQLLACAPLAAVAMPGRAAILFNLLGLDVATIRGVYEVPISKKIGFYVPGTRIPILPDVDFPFTDYQGPVVNMAWHIPGEIESRWRGLGFKGEIIQAIDPSDFN